MSDTAANDRYALRHVPVLHLRRVRGAITAVIVPLPAFFDAAADDRSRDLRPAHAGLKLAPLPPAEKRQDHTDYRENHRWD